MRTLIIPAAGKSSRFPNMKPKWLLTHPTGELMISMVLTPALVSGYDKIYITILDYHRDQYDAVTILNQIIAERKIPHCEVVVLSTATKSASETVYETIKQKKIVGAITIKDSDCIVDFVFDHTSYDFLVGLDINTHPITNPGNKSYLITDEHDIIQDIVEKSVVSNIMCAGVYSLDNCKLFRDTYDLLVASGLFESRELFVSHIFSYLIQKQIISPQYVECTGFADWGTLQDWREEQKRHKTYLFDIDGVLVENVGKYGKQNWYNSNIPIMENVQLVKELADKGNQIIFITARDTEGVRPIIQMLQEYQITYHNIIVDCYHSQRVIINDHSATNPYPSCDSISINRNEILKNYICSQ